MTSKTQLEPLQITHINTITFISITSEGKRERTAKAQQQN